MQDQAELIGNDQHWSALVSVNTDRHWSALVMRSSNKFTSGSTWPCLLVKITCFGYAVPPPPVMYWQFLLMFNWCPDPALISIEGHFGSIIICTSLEKFLNNIVHYTDCRDSGKRGAWSRVWRVMYGACAPGAAWLLLLWVSAALHRRTNAG